jgi:hypothetical protein
MDQPREFEPMHGIGSGVSLQAVMSSVFMWWMVETNTV